MRTKATIREALESLDASTPEDGIPVAWRGDNFKYGFWVGKMIALGWLLGEDVQADLLCQLDYEDWQREFPELRGTFPHS